MYENNWALAKSIFRFLGGITLLVFVLSSSLTQAQVQNPTQDQIRFEKVKTYLATQSTIRVGISEAGNNGHQSAGATVVTRLRELGFSGTIEVVYEKAVKTKLGFLIPPFNPAGGDTQNFHDERLIFLDETQMANRPRVAPGIMGADDRNRRASFLNTDVLLKLQPRAWLSPNEIQVRGTLALDASLSSLHEVGYVFQLPSPTNAPEFIQENMTHIQSLREKVPGLQAIARNLDHLELAAAYGHGLKRGSQIVAYLAAIQSAANARPDLFKGGVVVPLISSLNRDQLLKTKNYLEKNRQLFPSLRYIDVSSKNLAASCETLQPGQILLVNVGVVSKPVFEYLYQASSIAPIVEGLNTINLMQLTGKPYLPSWFSEHFHFRLRSSYQNNRNRVAEQAAENLTKYVGNPEDSTAPDVDANDIPAISRFMIEAKIEGSAVQKLFAREKTDVSSFAEDQLARGLLETQENAKVKLLKSIVMVQNFCGYVMETLNPFNRASPATPRPAELKN